MARSRPAAIALRFVLCALWALAALGVRQLFAEAPAEAPLLGRVERVDEATFRVAQDADGRGAEPVATGRTTRLYDTAGRLVTMSDFDEGGRLRARWDYAYDAAGRKREEAYRPGGGAVDSRWVYRYDAAGRLAEARYYYSDGSLQDRWTYAYDSEGREIAASWYGGEGGLEGRTSSTYAADGSRVETSVAPDGPARGRPGEGSPAAEIRIFDAAGRLVEERSLDATGAIAGRIVHSYDDRGNEMSTAVHRAGEATPDLTTYAYEYDAAGNWIRRTAGCAGPGGTGASAACQETLTIRTIVYRP